MTARPSFLAKNHENGQTIIAAFQALPVDEKKTVDAWLLVEKTYGSITWQEQCLVRYLDDCEEM